MPYHFVCSVAIEISDYWDLRNPHKYKCSLDDICRKSSFTNLLVTNSLSGNSPSNNLLAELSITLALSLCITLASFSGRVQAVEYGLLENEVLEFLHFCTFNYHIINKFVSNFSFTVTFS